jgi:hypothetical protein
LGPVEERGEYDNQVLVWLKKIEPVQNILGQKVNSTTFGWHSVVLLLKEIKV